MQRSDAVLDVVLVLASSTRMARGIAILTLREGS